VGIARRDITSVLFAFDCWEVLPVPKEPSKRIIEWDLIHPEPLNETEDEPEEQYEDEQESSAARIRMENQEKA
jgi:hypothetical protein